MYRQTEGIKDMRGEAYLEGIFKGRRCRALPLEVFIAMPVAGVRDKWEL